MIGLDTKQYLSVQGESNKCAKSGLENTCIAKSGELEYLLCNQFD